MLSSYEASVLTAFRTSDDGRRPVAFRTAVSGVGVLAAVSVTLAIAWAQVPSAGSNTTSASRRAETGGVSRPDAVFGRAMSGDGTRVSLFIGYVEFDWDTDRPGGVPGFAPLPPSMSKTDVAAADRAGD